MRKATLLFAGIALLSCQRTQAPEAAPPAALPPAQTAQSALEQMDTRAPVPLLPMMAHHQKQNMRDHLLAVQEILVAVGARDFAAVERSAARIGTSEQMTAMCQHMGMGAPGFTDVALNFHRTADEITAAAKRQDAAAVTAALGRTLATCTGCHQSYRQQVVDETTWAEITRAPPPQLQHHPMP